jgi:predicted PurR-regulated permease PerM
VPEETVDAPDGAGPGQSVEHSDDRVAAAVAAAVGSADPRGGEPDPRAADPAPRSGAVDAQGRPWDRRATDRVMPRWVIPSVAVFWTGFVLSFAFRHVFHRLSSLLVLLLVSLFLALAVEPGVNRLAARGWRRGRATILILLGVLFAFLVFVAAVGTLVGTQVAELLEESDSYITDTVDFINDTFGTEIDPAEVIDEFNDPDGAVQQFVKSQSDEAVQFSLTVLGVIFQGLSVLLFTYYLVADGPRLRRTVCSRLPPARQERVLSAWELAITKTGGYLYSRALLALLSAFFHWIVFQAIGTPAPVALALWVGLVSQFLPVVGTYLAGILPAVLTFLDSPLKAAIVVAFIVIYQQVENYVFAPRITARTMELHPAVAFGAALAGAALLGPIGAVLALPAAAMMQALAGEWGKRYEVVDSHLTTIPVPKRSRTQRGAGPDPGVSTETV